MKFSLSGGKWKRRDLILFLERLSLYVSSGLTIGRSLRIASEGVPRRQATTIDQVRRAVEAGEMLSQSLSVNLKMPETLIAIIRSGETTGKLGQALGCAHDLLEREEDLQKKCVSAMIYPIIIGLFATVMTIGLVRGVMPQIVPMLKGMHVQLPLITRAIMAVSDALVDYGLAILVSIVVIIPVLIFANRKFRQVRTFSQAILIRVPIVGRFVRLYHISLFVQSLGSLVESGVPLANAYLTTVTALSLAPVRIRLQKGIESIRHGQTMSSVMARISGLPPYLPPLVSAGEMSGALGSSLLRAARIIDKEVEHSLKRLTSLIEPVMMAAMGCVVGAVALSIVMPIYDMSKVLQH